MKGQKDECVRNNGCRIWRHVSSGTDCLQLVGGSVIASETILTQNVEQPSPLRVVTQTVRARYVQNDDRDRGDASKDSKFKCCVLNVALIHLWSRAQREQKGSLVRLVRLRGGYSPLVVKNGTRPSTSGQSIHQSVDGLSKNYFRILGSGIVKKRMAWE